MEICSFFVEKTIPSGISNSLSMADFLYLYRPLKKFYKAYYNKEFHYKLIRGLLYE